ncbi:methionine/alanine import family NSS transporter small subunit [Alkalihalobacillus deserti]|nr:methionine/alanine import family NSS transporter small subunit [Alkalihalobacillus deserti]
MSTSAVVMMIIGMIVIWGGMGLSIANAVKVSKAKK